MSRIKATKLQELEKPIEYNLDKLYKAHKWELIKLYKGIGGVELEGTDTIRSLKCKIEDILKKKQLLTREVLIKKIKKDLKDLECKSEKTVEELQAKTVENSKIKLISAEKVTAFIHTQVQKYAMQLEGTYRYSIIANAKERALQALERDIEKNTSDFDSYPVE